MAILCSTAAVPLAVAAGAPGAVMAALGFLGTLMTGLKGVFRWHENWIRWGQTRAAIETELVHYIYESRPYHLKKTAARVLAQRVEEITTSETTAWAEMLRRRTAENEVRSAEEAAE